MVKEKAPNCWVQAGQRGLRKNRNSGTFPGQLIDDDATVEFFRGWFISESSYGPWTSADQSPNKLQFTQLW